MRKNSHKSIFTITKGFLRKEIIDSIRIFEVQNIVPLLVCFGKYCYLCTRSTTNHTLMDIGNIIKERRALLGISQQDLADYSGVGISTIKDLERGVGNPSLQTLQKILNVVGMEMVLQVKQTV